MPDVELDREAEQLIRRAVPLLFGIIGRTLDEKGDTVQRAAGSGIIIAPFTALTARHVGRDLMHLDSRYERLPRGTFLTQFGCSMFQLHKPFTGEAVQATWQVNELWPVKCTDVSILHFSADQGMSAQLQREMSTRPYDWHLLPPPVGSMVTAMGFPSTALTMKPDGVYVETSFIFQRALVTDIYERERDRGMLNFPCFQIDKALEHGFSGGPVFFEDQLCGIVSAGPSWEPTSYVATLWPICLAEYDDGLGGLTRFADLFEHGAIRSSQWHEVRKRMRTDGDDGERCYLANPEE